jgi:hypothetical protein
MILLWLFVWWCYHTPPLHEWNGWLVSMIVCAALTLSESRRVL